MWKPPSCSLLDQVKKWHPVCKTIRNKEAMDLRCLKSSSTCLRQTPYTSTIEVQGISRCCERQSDLFLKTGHTQVYKHMVLATLRRIEQCQAVQHWTSKPSPSVDILRVNNPYVQKIWTMSGRSALDVKTRSLCRHRSSKNKVSTCMSKVNALFDLAETRPF